MILHQLANLFEEELEYPSAAQLAASLKRIIPTLETKKFTGDVHVEKTLNKMESKKFDLISGWPLFHCTDQYKTGYSGIYDLMFKNKTAKCTVVFVRDKKSKLLYATNAVLSVKGKAAKTYILHKDAFLHHKTHMNSYENYKYNPLDSKFTLENIKSWLDARFENFCKHIDDFGEHSEGSISFVKGVLDHIETVKKVFKEPIDKLVKQFFIKILLKLVKECAKYSYLRDLSPYIKTIKRCMELIAKAGYDSPAEFASITKSLDSMVKSKKPTKSVRIPPDNEWITEQALLESESRGIFYGKDGYLIFWVITPPCYLYVRTFTDHTNSIRKDYELGDKKEILKLLLTVMKQDDINYKSIKKFISSCREYGVDYPEFSIIEKSLESR